MGRCRNCRAVSGREGAAPMIPLPAGCRVWIATGHTDMRRGMQGLALQVQEHLKRDPHAGDLYIFRDAAAISRKSSGTTGSACRFTPSGSTAESSSGPRRARARCRFRPRRWPICWKASTGEIHNSPSGRRARGETKKIWGRPHFGAPQIERFVIHFASWTLRPKLFSTKMPC